MQEPKGKDHRQSADANFRSDDIFNPDPDNDKAIKGSTIDAVSLDAIDPSTHASGAVWQTRWASLTFATNQK